MDNSQLDTTNSIVLSKIDTKYRMRIKEIKMIPAKSLMSNDGNWRIHPIVQKEALLGDLEEIGVTDVLKAYHSEREGGALVLIDGHLRKNLDPDQLWVVVILDLDDAEADKQLALHDSIGEMALDDPVKLDDLIRNSIFENQRMKDTANRIQSAVAESAEIARRMLADGDSGGGGKSESAIFDERITQMKGKSVKVVIGLPDEIKVFESAIKATGVKNRGKAMLMICQFYLDMAGGGKCSIKETILPFVKKCHFAVPVLVCSSAILLSWKRMAVRVKYTSPYTSM